MVDAELGAALFSQTYAEARGKFLTAAVAAGRSVVSREHPLPGRDGEPLALDVVCDGPADSSRQLIVSSVCHGVEGFCGSAVQTMLLGDAAFRSACRNAQVSVLYLHALNPWGFSWWRRTTEENIDLNRNFLDFSQPLPGHLGYDDPGDMRAVANMFAQQGAQLSVAPARGGAPDLHSGLGPSGVGERILAAPDDPVTLARTRRWWGAGVTSIGEGNSSSAPLEGLMFQAMGQECPAVEYTGIALEFGTVPLLAVLDALRGDQWLQTHADVAGPELTDTIKRQLRDAFYVDSIEWKQQVLSQAAEAARQAVIGLSES